MWSVKIFISPDVDVLVGVDVDVFVPGVCGCRYAPLHLLYVEGRNVVYIYLFIIYYVWVSVLDFDS